MKGISNNIYSLKPIDGTAKYEAMRALIFETPSHKTDFECVYAIDLPPCLDNNDLAHTVSTSGGPVRHLIGGVRSGIV